MAPAAPVGQKPVCYPRKDYMFDANGNTHPPKPGDLPFCKAEPKAPANGQSKQHKNEQHAFLFKGLPYLA